MRSKLFVLSVAFAAGCGGGGGKKANLVDAMIDSPTIDTPPACAVMASLGNLNLGSAAAPVAGEWFDTTRGGSLMGRTVLSIGGRLPSSTATLLDVLIVDYVKPATGNFQTNTAINFDPNPKSAPPVAMSYVFGDFDMGAMTVQNFYYASNGSITLNAVGTTNGAPINGSPTLTPPGGVSATNYREIDDMNNDVAGGCTTSLGGLGFFLTEMMGTAFQNQDPSQFEGLKPLTVEEWTAINKIRAQKMPGRL